MKVIPAVDIRDGKCVMLEGGRIEKEKIYSDDPVFIAKMWEAKGARRIHIVDLDAAIIGSSKNVETIRRIREEVSVELEVGGGLRSEKSVSYFLDLGIDKVIISTILVYNPPEAERIMRKYGNRILPAIDVKKRKVMIGGWKEETKFSWDEIINRIRGCGLRELVITDVDRDGTLKGVNMNAVRQVLSLNSDMDIIISGGIKSILELKKLKEIGVYGVIIGKAIYEEKIDLSEALRYES